jgi:glycerophosphoryl diester phosphodiesterase
MAAPLPSLLQPPVAFAHRGARAHAPENTIEAFDLALKLGATGIESDAWVTSDGTVVLDHDGMVGRRPLRKPIATVRRDALPAHWPTLDELYDHIGAAVPVSLDIKDPAAFEPVLEVSRRRGAHAQLWLCHGDLDVLRDWRAADQTVRLVHSTRLKRCEGGLERHAARLAELAIDVINMPLDDWSGGNVALAHRFQRYAFAWNAQLDRHIVALLGMGIDAVYSDWSDRLADAFRVFGFRD